MFGYWIQRHNYSAEGVARSSESETIEAYLNFDWDSELGKFREGESGVDCPPGIGVNNSIALSEPLGLLLHICPYSQTEAFVNFHFQKGTRIFGLFPSLRSEVHHSPVVDRSSIPGMIRNLYRGELKELKWM